MRILHTIGRTAPNSTDADLLGTIRWQLGRGCHVVLSAPRRAAIAERAQAAGLILAPAELAAGFAGREAAILRTAVRNHAIEVIHVHDEAASIPALMCADLCPIVRTLDDVPETALPFDHVIVGTASLRNRLLKAELVEPEHVTMMSGAAEARMERVLEAYERAIVRSITGRLIPARFVAGRPELRRLAPLAAE
jgi:hypothetical protein